VIVDKVYDLVANESFTSQIIVFGHVISSQRANFTQTDAGIDLFLNSLNWLVDREQSITIRPKLIQETPLKVTQAIFNLYGIISVIIVPLGALALGIVVWLRRRHL
jgi:ABC-2 type transport system permease protein